MSGSPGLTIFACPKPFVDPHIACIQRNALRSWMHLDPRPEIIVVGDEPGAGEVCRELGLVHIPHLARTRFGTPLLSDIFRRAEEAASSSLMAYVNADIILLQDFADAIRSLTLPSFLLVGQRWDVDIREPLNFASAAWAGDLRSLIAAGATLHPHTGIDYFVFSKGLFSGMPPFALGRTTFDNWLLWRAHTLGCPVVDATEAVTCVHQNHGYSYELVGQAPAGGLDDYGTGEEARLNRALAPGRRLTTLRECDHRLTRQGLRQRSAAYVLARRLLLQLPTRDDVRTLGRGVIAAACTSMRLPRRRPTV
ncbi:MAG: hypothetical protein LAP87_03170 [Acidobacteriia bacterium]|nr:hypothetical protein [Terriglobia bacterium]